MKRIALLLLVIGAALVALPLYFENGSKRPYQGWVEADLLFIGPETAGRLTSVTVAEGDSVESGTPLFGQDDTAAKAAVAARTANIAALQAQYQQAVIAQKRPEEITILQASERQAEAELALAVQDLQRARALAEAGTVTRANLDAAVATEAANRAALDNIRGQIVLARLPSRDEAIRQMAETVAVARAERDEAANTLARLSVTAPVSGTVQTVYYKAGEVVPAGRPVVALLSPDAIRIRFFVPETDMAGIERGRQVRATCDGCPPTTARISFISTSVEYTPPEIYSLEERAKLVYRVEAVSENPQAMKPGLPVDVTLAASDPR